MMDFDVIITGGIGIATTFISGFTSYIFTKRKYDTEVEGSKIENVQKALKFYEDNQALNNQIMKENREEIEELRKENVELKNKVDEYEKTIKSLHQQNIELSERVSKLEKIITSLNKTKNGAKTKKNSKEK